MAERIDRWISVRHVGDAQVALISVGELFGVDLGFPADREWTHETDERGRTVAGLQAALIRTPDAVVLVDPAFFLSAEEAAGYFDGELHLMAEEALERLGVAAEDVTHVLVTHAHRDHYWGVLAQRDGVDVARFPNAEHFVAAADWELPYPGALLGLASDGTFGGVDEAAFTARLHHYFAPVVQAGRLRLVEGDVEVVPGVTLVWTGGETEGHQVVRLERDGEVFLYLGDLVHMPDELRDLEIAPGRVGGKQMDDLVAARRRLFGEAAERDATVVYTHSRFPGWGRVEADGDVWAWRAG